MMQVPSEYVGRMVIAERSLHGNLQNIWLHPGPH